MVRSYRFFFTQPMLYNFKNPDVDKRIIKDLTHQDKEHEFLRYSLVQINNSMN